MPALFEYANVNDTVVAILKAKGFQVWHDSDRDLYCGERGGWDFESETLCGLLGLVAIFEFKSPSKYEEYWWRETGSEPFGQLPTGPTREFHPVWLRTSPPNEK